MKIFNDFDWSFKGIAKILGLFLLGTLSVAYVMEKISAPQNFSSYFEPSYNRSPEAAPFMTADVVKSELKEFQDAEDFEVNNYRISYETNQKEKTCREIRELKTRDDVIFEKSTEGNNRCEFNFKVSKDSVSEVIKVLEGLNPENIILETHTIQKTIEGQADEITVLKNKLSSIRSALSEAESAYNDLTLSAKKQRDIESLTKLIELKLNSINKLSEEQLSISYQIKQALKRKTEQQDLLEYTRFWVYVGQNLLFDWEAVKSSWKQETKEMVKVFNSVLQGVTVNLLSFILRAIQFTLYAVIGLVLLKIVWSVGVRVWRVGSKDGKDKMVPKTNTQL